jgi:hypothetical protein
VVEAQVVVEREETLKYRVGLSDRVVYQAAVAEKVQAAMAVEEDKQRTV